MDICGDVAMEMDLARVRKRHCMDEIGEYPTSKRACRDLESIANGGGILLNQLNECDVVYVQMQMAANKNPFQTFTPQRHQNLVPLGGGVGPGKPCPRCIAGESKNAFDFPLHNKRLFVSILQQTADRIDAFILWNLNDKHQIPVIIDTEDFMLKVGPSPVYSTSVWFHFPGAFSHHVADKLLFRSAEMKGNHLKRASLIYVDLTGERLLEMNKNPLQNLSRILKKIKKTS